MNLPQTCRKHTQGQKVNSTKNSTTVSKLKKILMHSRNNQTGETDIFTNKTGTISTNRKTKPSVADDYT